MGDKKAMVAVDFMAYAKKVPVKKTKLKTYGDIAKHLWNTFKNLTNSYATIDIIFGLYISCSVKDSTILYRLVSK